MLYIIRRKIMCNGKSMKMSGKVKRLHKTRFLSRQHFDTMCRVVFL